MIDKLLIVWMLYNIFELFIIEQILHYWILQNK